MENLCTITGKIKNVKLTEINFISQGCAISKASASIFTESVKGKAVSRIKKLTKEDVLKNLPVEITAARYNCALLCYHALQKELNR